MSVRDVARASLAEAYPAYGDHVARRHFIFFQRDERLARGILDAFGIRDRHHFLRAAVHRIMQLRALQREVVAGGDRHVHFLNRVDLGVRARMRDLHRRRVVLTGFDEVVLAQTDALAFFIGREVE